MIFTASGTPGQDLPQFGWMDLFAKKGGHLLGYALLGIGYLRGLVYRRIPTRRDLVVAVLLACLYSATDEYHQRFTPDRSPSVQDIAIDTVGATIGVLLWPKIRARLARLLPWISQ